MSILHNDFNETISSVLDQTFWARKILASVFANNEPFFNAAKLQGRAGNYEW